MTDHNLFGNNGLFGSFTNGSNASPGWQQLARLMSDGANNAFMNNGTPSPSNNDWKPNLDVYEGPESYTMMLELSGMDRSSVTVNNEGQVLKISGSRSHNVDRTFNRKRSEWTLGAFERTFRLPSDADQTRISAVMENGVLSLVVPKIRFTPESTTITIGRNPMTEDEADSVVEQ